MIANTFGEDCEVVVHDLEDPEHSVVYVANNKVTGRDHEQRTENRKSKIYGRERNLPDEGQCCKSSRRTRCEQGDNIQLSE